MNNFKEIEKHLKVGCNVVVRIPNDIRYITIFADLSCGNEYVMSGIHSKKRGGFPGDLFISEEFPFATVEMSEIVEVFRPEPQERFKVNEEVIYKGDTFKIVAVHSGDFAGSYVVDNGNPPTSNIRCCAHHSELTYPIKKDTAHTAGNRKLDAYDRAIDAIDDALASLRKIK